jgi:hypothetical protein
VTNEELVGTAVALIVANGATVYGFARWGIARAIEYTHLVRDVKELQTFRDETRKREAQVQADLKGLSQKIDRKTNNIPP